MSGVVKVNAVQLGDSATASQNFVLKSNVDGTAGLYRNADGSGGAILTVDAAGKVIFPLPPIQAVHSMIRLVSGNGYGTVNTAIRRFLTVLSSVGDDITYADSATLGASFTINVKGAYSIIYVDNFATAADCGISLNSTQLTTNIASINIANSLSEDTAGAANQRANPVWMGWLDAGDVIRPHAGSPPGATYHTMFTIARVS